MQRITSKITAFGYVHIAKPILFWQQPDKVHDRLLKLGSRMQRFGLVRWLVRTFWSYNNTDYLQQNVQGITFKNPVGLSAGFDKNFQLPPLMKSVGFGFMEGGSITLHECAGNPKPWFYRLPKTKSLVVNAGLANQGVDAISERLQAYSGKGLSDFPLNISIAKTNSPDVCDDDEAIADYAGTLIKLRDKDLGSMYTLNISCPNTYGGEPFTTPERLERLLAAVDEVKAKKPVFIKMPSNLPWSEFKVLVDVAVKHNIAGLTISNLAKDRGQANIMDPLPDDVKGNLSGLPTKELSNELIRQTYALYGDRFTIIGVGGIFNAEDAYEKIKYGATMVELITGMIFDGPQIVGQINRGLVELLKKDGYTHISQAIGVNATKK